MGMAEPWTPVTIPTLEFEGEAHPSLLTLPMSFSPPLPN